MSIVLYQISTHLLHYRKWDRNDRKNKQLKKFAAENQANILLNGKKRGRDANHAQHAQQEAQQLPLINSANDRPRNQPRREKVKSAEEDEPIFAARIMLAPAPVAAAPSAGASAAAAAAGTPQDTIVPLAITEETTQDPIMTFGEKSLRIIKRRKKVWSRLEKRGKIPSFLEEWMKYCKSLTAYECPDYDKLRALLEIAPEVAHIAETFHAKQPGVFEKEE
jgi:hypothetical protein